MKTIELTFDNDDMAIISSMIIEDALGGYSSPRHLISGIAKGIDYELTIR